MGHGILAFLTPALVVLFGSRVICTNHCTRACDENKISIDCGTSVILVSDVTDLAMERNSAFENIKRDCMGRVSCNPSRTCNTATTQVLLVHYVCVNKSKIMSKSCNGQVIKMNSSYEYIQSIKYPAAPTNNNACRWEIEPPGDSAVVLSLHDIVFTNNKENCEVLVVTGQQCNGQKSTIPFCGRDNITSLTRCGKVGIEMRASGRQFQMRFWLSFRVLQREQVRESQNPMLRCSAPFYDIEGQHSQDGVLTTEHSSMSGVYSQDSNTEVLVIMLSIISGISAVLLIILIVVCVRCRLLQASQVELAYSDPSQSVQAHYEYITTSETEKTRPHLAEGYFEVADAVPFTQRFDTSTSPGYAEIEQFSHLTKVLQSSSSEECLRRCKSLNEEKHYDSVLQATEEIQIDNSGGYVETGRSNCRVLGRLKDKTSKQDKKERNNFKNKRSTDLKVTSASIKKEATSDNSPALSHSGVPTQMNSEDDGCCHYEPIEKYLPIKFCSNSEKRPHVPGNHPCSRKLSADILLSKNCPKTLDKVNDNIKHYSERCSATQPFPQFLDMTTSMMNTAMKTDCISKTTPSNFSERSKTLPSRKSKACLQTQEAKNNNFRHAAYKDMPRASGIVRNGIKKFEQNST